MKPARLLGTTFYTDPQRSQRRPWVSVFDRADREFALWWRHPELAPNDVVLGSRVVVGIDGSSQEDVAYFTAPDGSVRLITRGEFFVPVRPKAQNFLVSD